jgi:hypothetical protein
MEDPREFLTDKFNQKKSNKTMKKEQKLTDLDNRQELNIESGLRHIDMHFTYESNRGVLCASRHNSFRSTMKLSIQFKVSNFLAR